MDVVDEEDVAVGENLLGVRMSVGRFVGGRFVKAPWRGVFLIIENQVVFLMIENQVAELINTYCSYISNEETFKITATE